MVKKEGLLSIVLSGVMFTLAGTALVKSFVDNYYDNLPGVVYLVHGKKIMERRFKTNEEAQRYMESKEGKEEAEYYRRMNDSK